MDLATAKAQSGPIADKVHLWATVLSYAVIAMMSVVLWIHIQDFRHVVDNHSPNPHYGETRGEFHCDDCHDVSKKDACTPEKIDGRSCFECHDKDDTKIGPIKYESELKLCTACHAPNVYVVYKHGEVRAELDLIRLHPYGSKPTPETYPTKLPLNEDGRITCTTCHNPHGQDPKMKLLRIYHPENGTPADVLPLCYDCHKDGNLL